MHSQSGSEYGEASTSQEGGAGAQYVDDAQIYEYDHGHEEAGSAAASSEDGGGYHAREGYAHGQAGSSQDGYYYTRHNGEEDGGRHGDGEDDLDMW